jgi:hypothetical protein
LQRLLDGELLSEAALDLGDPVEDPGTGMLTWSGTINLTSFGDYSVVASISNDQGPATYARGFRLEQTVAELQSQVPQVTISGLGQQPANCLFPNVLLGVINGLIGDIFFFFTLPSGADILAGTGPFCSPPGCTVTLDLPVLGGVDVVLTLDEPNNDILMDGPDNYIINLTGLAPIPGFDCIITGAADGAWDDTDPGDLDGSLTVSITDVQADPDGQGCSLSAPTGECNLIVGLDADP